MPLRACLGGLNPGLLDHQDGLLWSQVGLQQYPKTSHISSRCRREKAGPVNLRELFIGSRRSRPCSRKQTRQRHVFYSVHDTEEKRYMVASNKLNPSQFLYPKGKVQNGIFIYDSTISTSGGLDDFNQSKRCILSRASGNRFPTIPPLCGRQSASAVHMSTLRPNKVTSGLLQGPLVCCGSTSHQGGSSPPLFRQPTSPSSEQRSTFRAQELSHLHSALIRVASEFREEPSRGNSIPGVSWGSLQHIGRHHLPSRGEDWSDSRQNTCSPCVISPLRSPMPESNWHDDSHHSYGDIPMAQWHTRPFQKGFLQQWDSSSQVQRIHLTPTMRTSLLWWLQGKNLRNHHSIIPISWVTLTSDASNRGWGAHCLSEVAQGQWIVPAQGIVSNILELRAAFQALLSFYHLIEGSSVMLRLDNTTAVAYIKKQGGTRSCSLLQEVEPIMSWAQK